MSSNLLVISGLMLGVLVLVLCTVKFKIHPFFALIATTVTFAIVSGMNLEEMLAAFTSGMGGTMADIGLVIALGTVTGALLEKSGAAETMAKTILKITGKKHAALGLAITGYFVSIPVFCDSGFVVLSPISRALAQQSNVSLAVMGTALSGGLYATHCLVPPTPGPIAMAGTLEADLGLTIIVGLLVSIPAVAVAVLYANEVKADTGLSVSTLWTSSGPSTASSPALLRASLPFWFPSSSSVLPPSWTSPASLWARVWPTRSSCSSVTPWWLCCWACSWLST